MPVRRQIDLGTVGFGLVPNTRGLELALARLQKFGREVERLGTFTEDAVQKQHRKFAGMERTLASLFARVSATTERMKAAGVAAAEIDKVEQAYRRLTTTVTKNADALNRAQFQRGVVGMQAILAHGNRLAGAHEANRFAQTFRDLERAAILAVGPLSGVGARLAVLAALFESTGAKQTVFIAGLTGLVAGFSLLGIGAVKATMEMERFNAVLEAGTGAGVLVGREYQYLLGVADRLGQNIKGIVEPYAKFTTAARLSNVTLDDQRKIFEGATIAGTAMRLSSERMQFVFLALEQMISKGTVSTEELRRQLGDLLPGSIGLAAQAMGVSQEKLLQMVEAGEVLAEDLLPKLADRWVQVFGPAALRAAQSIQNEMQRVGTASFELLKAFDQVTGVSELWRGVVVATREALQFFTRNIQEVLASIGALAGATFAYLAMLVRWGAIIRSIASAYVALRTAILAADLAAATTVVGRLGTMLLRLGVVLGGAAVGYQMLHREQKPVLEQTGEFIKQTNEWIGIQEKLGSAHKQTSEQVMQQTATRLRAIYAEIAAMQAQLEVQLQIENRAARMTFRSKKGAGSALAPDKPEDDPEVKRIREVLKTLDLQRMQLEAMINRINDIPKETPAGKDTEGGTQFQNWVKSIRDSIREYQGLIGQIEASGRGQTAMEQAKGFAEALQKMADIPSKKAGALTKISEDLAKAGFGKAGSDVNNLQNQLAMLFTAIEQKKDVLKELEAFPKQLETAGKGVMQLFQDLEDRRVAAMAADPEALSQQRALERHLTDLRGHLTAMKLDQEQINFLVDSYRVKWNQVQGIEDRSKEIKKLRNDIEQLNNTIGDRTTRALEQYNDRIQTISQALHAGVIQHEEAIRLSELAYSDLLTKSTERFTLFGRQIRDVFRDIENSMASSLARITLRQQAGWRQMFDSIAQTALEFLYKMVVINPIMEGLFGSLHTGIAGTPTGLLEGFIRGFGPSVPKAGLPSGPGGFDESGFIGAFAGNFQHGGAFTVPGHGGPDSQFVAFNATPGERVSIETPAQQHQGGNVKVIINNHSGVPLEAEATPPVWDGEAMVTELLFRRLSRDAGARETLARMTSRPRH